METIATNVRIGNVSGEYTGYRNDSAQLTVDVRVYDHAYPVGNGPSIAISALVAYRSTSGGICAGQCRDALDYVAKCAAGWNEKKVARLAEIWETWHLKATPESVINEVREMFAMGENH